MTPDDLRKRAVQYRAMAATLTDAVAALHELADKYDALANAYDGKSKDPRSFLLP